MFSLITKLGLTFMYFILIFLSSWDGLHYVIGVAGSSSDGSGDVTTTEDSFSGDGLIVVTTSADDLTTDYGSGSGDSTVTVAGSSSTGSVDMTTTEDSFSGDGLIVVTTSSDDLTTDYGGGSGDTTVIVTTTEAVYGNTTTDSTMSCSATTATSRPLEISDISVPSTITTSQTFQLQFYLNDSTTGQRLDSLTWSDCSWSAAVTISEDSSYNQNISGTTTADIDPNLANVTITGLTLSTAGMVALQISMTTNPSAYQLTKLYGVQILSSAVTSVTSTEVVRIKFDLDYDTYANDEMKATVYNFFLSKADDDITMDIELQRGSIIAVVTIGSSSYSSISTVTTAVCSDHASNTTLTHLGQSITITSVEIGGGGDNSCNTQTSDTGISTLVLLIIGIVSGVVFLAVSVIVSYCMYTMYQKTKIHGQNGEKEVDFDGKFLGNYHSKDKLWEPSTWSLRDQSRITSASFERNEKRYDGFYGPVFIKRSSVGSSNVAPVETADPWAL